jgi:hypothetical protein
MQRHCLGQDRAGPRDDKALLPVRDQRALGLGSVEAAINLAVLLVRLAAEERPPAGSPQVAASRLDPSQIIYDALGPFPLGDPDKAAVWDEGAHTIALYRLRHGISDKNNPLGTQTRGASARAERARAQRRVEDAQRHLGKAAVRIAGRAVGR